LAILDQSISPDLLTITDEAVRPLVNRYWSTVAIYYIVIIAAYYGIRSIGAFVFFLAGAALRPHGSISGMFAVIGLVVSFVVSVALPIFIMATFYREFLEGQRVATGFWLTGVAVVVG